MQRLLSVGCMIAATTCWLADQAQHSIALFGVASLFGLAFQTRMSARSSH